MSWPGGWFLEFNYVLQALLCGVLAAMLIHRYFFKKHLNLHELLKRGQFSSWSGAAYFLLLLLQILILLVFALVLHYRAELSDAERALQCPSRPYSAWQCHSPDTSLLVTGTVAEALFQAVSTAIWLMFVCEWSEILRMPHFERMSRGFAIFALCNLALVIILSITSYSLTTCNNGCISQESISLNRALDVQIVASIAVAAVSVCVVGVYVLREFSRRFTRGLAIKFGVALGLAVVLFSVNFLLRLITLPFLLQSTCIWHVFEPSSNQLGSSSQSSTSLEGINNNTTLTFGVWTFTALLPLVLLHAVSQRIGGSKSAFQSKASQGWFDPLLEGLASSQPAPGEATSLQLINSDLSYSERQDASNFTADVVPQPAALQGEHRVQGVPQLVFRDSLRPPHEVCFGLGQAWVSMRVTEAERAFAGVLHRWNQVLDQVDQERMRKSALQGAQQNLSAAFGSLQEDAAYGKLRGWVREHGQAWVKYLNHLEDIHAAHRHWCASQLPIFKPSVAKSSRLTAATPTNLQLYHLRIGGEEGTSGGHFGALRLTTVGAFADHYAGFGDGGLDALLAKEAETAAAAAKGRIDERLNLEMGLADLRLRIHSRVSAVLPQALCAAVSTLLDSLEAALARQHHQHIRQWLDIGYLFQMQSLLSTQGSEIGMLEDMHHAMKLLEGVSVVLRVTDHFEVERPEGKGVLVHCPVSQELFELVEAVRTQAGLAPEVKIVPCLFTLGVNEKQTLANLPGVGAPEMQALLNTEGLAVLEGYRRRFNGEDSKGCYGPLIWADVSKNTVAGKRSLWESLGELVEVHAPSEKDVNILLDSAVLCRAMHGGRAVCCKSAKDRTSMASTLELSHVLQQMGVLGESEQAGEHMKQLLHSLRGAQGCRLRNCELNTGKAQYAFNSFQALHLPELLRPPAETAGKNVS